MISKAKCVHSFSYLRGKQVVISKKWSQRFLTFLLVALVSFQLQDFAEAKKRRSHKNYNSQSCSQLLSSKSDRVHFDSVREALSREVTNSHRGGISYEVAREIVMMELDLGQDDKGHYVWDYYCQKVFRIQWQRMPNSNQLNIEHTWPQSRFSHRFPRALQKTDLHHLFPTDSKANTIRDSYNFGQVVNETKIAGADCKDSRLGYNASQRTTFQPPPNHRGSVARALFYFSIRYQLPIDVEQEAILRQWHKEDPVSPDEIVRNDKIEAIQGNRNPFIDRPELVDQIPNFR